MKDYNEIASSVLERRDKYIVERNKRIKRTALALSCFVVIALAGLGVWKSGVFEKSPASSDTPPSLPLTLSAYAISESEYPEAAIYPDFHSMGDEEFTVALNKWRDEDATKKGAYKKLSPNLNDFLASSIPEFLSDAETENRVYAPVSVYMALSMLAELTDGDSRQQILDLVGSDSIDTLRKESNAVWNAHYSDDGRLTSVLSSSIWLNESVGFNDAVMNTLAKNYYASSYRGNMADPAFTKMLQTWLNDNTGGMLKDQIDGIEINPNTIMALATTIYYEAFWTDKFMEDNNEEHTFNTPSGDINTTFMCETRLRDNYYWGEKFGAISKSLYGGTMWFILPDEGYTPSDLLSDSETMDFIVSGGDWDKTKEMEIWFKTPKFDVSSQIGLNEGLQNLGVTDIFDQTKSDFSPMTTETKNLAITNATHGARVMIDEDGCTASAYTAMLVGYGAPEKAERIDFVLDRPFIFVVTSEVGLPLFVGVVNQPV